VSVSLTKGMVAADFLADLGYRIGHALPNHRVLVEVIQKNAPRSCGSPACASRRCTIGSGMVLAIGDLAGATFVTLRAATATQFARFWRAPVDPMHDRDRVAVRLSWSGMASP
jgi:hypothetical protein